MRIDCPCCGLRDAGEFTYYGDAAPRRMDADLTTTSDDVYRRANPAGPHRELWYHGMGCRSWLVVDRDTTTHAIGAVAFARNVARARKAAL